MALGSRPARRPLQGRAPGNLRATPSAGSHSTGVFLSSLRPSDSGSDLCCAKPLQWLKAPRAGSVGAGPASLQLGPRRHSRMKGGSP